MARRGGAELAYEALSIEGGLLSPEWLAKVAQLQAAQQAEADYRVPKGLSIRDEIGRYWHIAKAHWAETGPGSIIPLLRESFGFTSLESTAPWEREERSFPVGHQALGGRVPIVIAPAGLGIDDLSPELGDGGRRRSAFGLAQEALNAYDSALWAVAFGGATLRILRDNASLTRPAWIEADLGRIFAEERYPEFAALWLLLHESRFGVPGTAPNECALEKWRTDGLEQGTRAREHLRRGVEEALLELGKGFLALNEPLRAALHDGTLTKDALFQQLLRLVYRIIFLLTVEERGLLHEDRVTAEVRERYEKGYGTRRLRDRSVRRSAHDRFGDLWEGLKIVFRGLARGEAQLGLPALGGLFAEDQCPHLDSARLENRALLTAIFKLSWLKERAGLARVNWRDMGPEELGSVYESLLELIPDTPDEGRTFAFLTARGSARKKTGSYYTPDSLVQVLLDSAREPVIRQTLAHGRSLLELTIVDPTCGSGHFLLAAARRLASHLARQEANGTPTAAQFRHALRQVVGRCIFGVDMNPLAIELCKVALWMEAVEPGRPLSFLDSHLQVGNALLGTTPELMKEGIPDEAWAPIEGDEKKSAAALKKRNKVEGANLSLALVTPEVAEVTQAVSKLDKSGDQELAAVTEKEDAWDALRASAAFKHQQLVADAWCAAFVWPKPAAPNPILTAAPTNAVWRELRDPLTVKTVEEIARQYAFFHWHLAFPQVFARGGFDVVLGNPPWERVKLQEQEFFASRHEAIAEAENAALRKKLIAKLPESNPQLWRDWCEASRLAEGQSHFVRDSGRYPLCGKGDVNTYALFAEHNRAVLAPAGRAGFIVPTGLATDDTTKEYFGALVAGQELAAFYSFENEEFVFPGVHHAFRFALLTVARGRGAPAADLVFFARQVAALADANRHFTLTPADFATLNPNTRTCPTFRARRDAEINLALYRRAGVLWREDDEANGNPWSIRFMAMLHMANDSGLFKSRAELEASGLVLRGNRFTGKSAEWLPLIEAKMVHHFDHRFGTYEGQSEGQENQGKLPEFDEAAHADPERFTLPYYWVESGEVAARLEGAWQRGWLLGWRDICRSTDQRTLIASVVPRAGTGDTFLLALPQPAAASLFASLCSFALDYAARQKVGGTHLKYHVIKQLPVLAPSAYDVPAKWSPNSTVRDWLLPRVLELTYTAWDLEPFAKDVGYSGPPFKWNTERRFLLRCELDAAFFHLYGLTHDDADYILDTFPIVKKNDEKAHGGVYRTKKTILELYDAMATEQPYRTRLDPPPADPRVAHAAR